MSQAAKRIKMSASVELSAKCINTIRVMAADVVQAANSGHPGAPLGCAPMAYLLWTEIMKYSPENPKWPSRDRFVLSNGHACALQYSMLHLTGYNITTEDLEKFRQIGSITPGHPEVGITDGVEVSTGPLGQGISNAVGLALTESHLAATFNKPDMPLIDNFTYVICGDGCLQEGVSSEASSLAGTLGLGKLIVLYDDNNITIDGGTELSFTEDVGMRYESYGWHVQTVEDGNIADMTSLHAAVKAAQAVTDKPSLIKVKTIIGFGAKMQNTHKVHGAPLGDEDIAKIKTDFGLDPAAKFQVPAEVKAVFDGCKAESKKVFASWSELKAKYAAAYPAEAATFDRMFKGELPAGWDAELPTYAAGENTMATRKYSNKVLEKIVASVPELVGGCADLTPSCLTKVAANSVDYSKATPEGRYVRFGVREHGMSSVCNGMAAYGGLIPFGATFLVFSGYAMGAIRLSALSHFKVLYIMTHDSIGLGEDGPTHQPVETLSALRCIPNLLTIRPADGNETSGAYKLAMENAHGPTLMAFSRQNCVNLAGSSIDAVAKGAYVVQEAEGTQAFMSVILVATGSEVQLAIEAAKALQAAGKNTRVVSMPCWSLFDAQPEEYRNSVFLSGKPVLSIEAASTFGWSKYAHAHVGMTSFGASGKGPKVMEHFGFSVDSIVAKATKLADHYKGAAPELARLLFH